VLVQPWSLRFIRCVFPYDLIREARRYAVMGPFSLIIGEITTV